MNKFFFPFFISFHFPISSLLSFSKSKISSFGILITRGPVSKVFEISRACSNSFVVVGHKTVKFCMDKKNDKSYKPL